MVFNLEDHAKCVTSLRHEQQSVVVIYFDLSKAFDKNLDNLDTCLQLCNPDDGLWALLMIVAGSEVSPPCRWTMCRDPVSEEGTFIVFCPHVMYAAGKAKYAYRRKTNPADGGFISLLFLCSSCSLSSLFLWRISCDFLLKASGESPSSSVPLAQSPSSSVPSAKRPQTSISLFTAGSQTTSAQPGYQVSCLSASTTTTCPPGLDDFGTGWMNDLPLCLLEVRMIGRYVSHLVDGVTTLIIYTLFVLHK
ncbi:unnamed protein product [Schistocephalus solidus]|uniref:Reverse transcriptase domain-containing protein n=1 Tax=Schistocephalus solidus TaxID=70667 RepID=A0A183TMT3_SCHSO|nr:unnamed protein product [Schistocephalus solidus]